MKAIILAAGYATRLFPLTRNIPKPLLHVTPDKTVIDFIVDDLVNSVSLDEIIVVTNDKFYSDFCNWASKMKSGCPVSVLNDGTKNNNDRLGAIGDIIFALDKKKIDSDLIIIGGDNLFDRGFKKFFKFALSNRDSASLGLFDIGDKNEATHFGVVDVDSGNKVVSFEEKPKHPKSSLVATCLYYFPKATLGLLRQYVKDPSTIKDAPGNYMRWLMKKSIVYGFVLSRGHWYDIGHLDSYKEVVKQYNTNTLKKTKGETR